MTYAFSRSNTRVRALSALALASCAAITLAGCSAQGSAADTGGGADSNDVTIVVHDSFVDGAAFEQAASAATGYNVTVMTAGDGGELTNKLVLTKGAPIADAFFGVDNTFASRIVENDVAAEYTPAELPARAAEYAIGSLVPIDMGATCINIDTAWFAEHGVAEPETYTDLTDETYRDLTVLIDPTASSTGASFMIGTVAEFGEDGFADYWTELEGNGVSIAQGWSDAYYEQFSGASETGTRPIVLSYSTSPAFTVNEDETESSTRALLDTCTTQVEYAGVLAGAANPAGAQAVIDYLLSGEFQQGIADQMYMYPIDDTVELPAAWSAFAPQPSAEQVNDLTPAEIEAGREAWLRSLADAVGL